MKKQKTIKDLQQMIKEPASKEWFAKHGTPHSSARETALNRKKEPHLSQKLQDAGYSRHRAQKHVVNKQKSDTLHSSFVDKLKNGSN